VSDSNSPHDLGRIVCPDFRQILENFRAQLELRETDINNLNVFPVPDADTGTNSLLTIQAGLTGLASSADSDELLPTLVREFAQYASFHARGNSGTILAEYFRGISLVLTDAADATNWQSALKSAAVCAHQAVLAPCDGTILSVANAIAQVPTSNDLATFLDDVTRIAKAALTETTGQLEQLREAQVVDAGACVLVLFHEVVSSFYNQQQTDISFIKAGTCASFGSNYSGPEFEVTLLVTASHDIRTNLRDALASLGESLTIAGSSPEFKVHIHTDEVEAVIHATSVLGEVSLITTASLAEFIAIP
jgi:uncharacterized protein